jgi:hypothetical protein
VNLRSHRRGVIVDKTKAIVESADPVKPKIVQGFLEYAQARGFAIDATRWRSPKDKGRVERPVLCWDDDPGAGAWGAWGACTLAASQTDERTPVKPHRGRRSKKGGRPAIPASAAAA